MIEPPVRIPDHPMGAKGCQLPGWIYWAPATTKARMAAIFRITIVLFASDDPRDELAHSGVGIGVCAASDRNHRRKFGIAQRSKCADNGYQHKRQGQRWTGPRPPDGCSMPD